MFNIKLYIYNYNLIKFFPSIVTHALDSQTLYNHASYILPHFIGEKTGVQTSDPTPHSQEAVKSHLDTSLSDNQAICFPP